MVGVPLPPGYLASPGSAPRSSGGAAGVQDHDRTAERATTLTVTVTSVVGFQRVLTMLLGRRYPVRRLAAEETDDGRWRVELLTLVDPGALSLLTVRLERLPDVLLVEAGAGVRAASAR